jgi:hypothetical protein
VRSFFARISGEQHVRVRTNFRGAEMYVVGGTEYIADEGMQFLC